MNAIPPITHSHYAHSIAIPRYWLLLILTLCILRVSICMFGALKKLTWRRQNGDTGFFVISRSARIYLADILGVYRTYLTTCSWVRIISYIGIFLATISAVPHNVSERVWTFYCAFLGRICISLTSSAFIRPFQLPAIIMHDRQGKKSRWYQNYITNETTRETSGRLNRNLSCFHYFRNIYKLYGADWCAWVETTSLSTINTNLHFLMILLNLKVWPQCLQPNKL